jgi:hypothetical protein
METIARGGMALFWLGLLASAQIADLITTVASLRLGGVESNPLVRGLIADAGMNGYASIRLLAIALGVALLWLAGSLLRRLPGRLAHGVSLTLAVGLQIGVVVQVFAVIANLIALNGELRA